MTGILSQIFLLNIDTFKTAHKFINYRPRFISEYFDFFLTLNIEIQQQIEIFIFLDFYFVLQVFFHYSKRMSTFSTHAVF